MAAPSWTALDAIMDYRAANAILKLSQNYDYLGVERQKGKKTRVRVLKPRSGAIPFPMRPRPLSVLLDGSGPQVQSSNAGV